MKSDFLGLQGNHFPQDWGSHYKIRSWWSWRSRSSRCWRWSRHSQIAKMIQSFGALWRKWNFGRESLSPWVSSNTDSEKYFFSVMISFMWETYFCIILPDKSDEDVEYILMRFYWFKIFFCLAILIGSLYSEAERSGGWPLITPV